MSELEGMTEEQKIRVVVNNHFEKVLQEKRRRIEDGQRGMEFVLYHHEVYPSVIQALDDVNEFDRLEILSREVIQSEEGPLVMVSILATW